MHGTVKAPFTKKNGRIGCDVSTPAGILSYPHLWKPHAAVPGSDAKFSAMILLEKSEPAVGTWLAQVAGIINQIKASHWPGNPGIQLQLPIEDGDTAVYTKGPNAGQLKKANNPEFANRWLVTAKSKDGPVVVYDEYAQEVQQENTRMFYAGCRAIMHFALYSYDAGSVGIGGGINCIQRVGEGTPLGNQRDFSADIQPIAGVAPPAAGNPFGAPAPAAAPAPVAPAPNPFGAPAPAPAPVAPVAAPVYAAPAPAADPFAAAQAPVAPAAPVAPQDPSAMFS